MKKQFKCLLASVHIEDDMKLPYQKYFFDFIKNDDELKDMYSYFWWLQYEFRYYQKSGAKTFEQYLYSISLTQSLEKQLKALNISLESKD